MMLKITDNDIKQLASKNGYEFPALKAIIAVESGGVGFSQDGKIIIQFEPAWFKKKAPFTPSGCWSLNKVECQLQEWKAFNNAYLLNPTAAMESTSIGMMQVMGFHYKITGFKSVGEMWDYAKVSEANQLDIAIRFIKTKKLLDYGLKQKDWPTVAYYYNGAAYRKFRYDEKLKSAYSRHL